MLNKKQIILLVEDNDDDAELTIRAFGHENIKNKIVRVSDGQEALDYLLKQGAYKDCNEFPAVVLLDLNLPGLDGLTLLKLIRSHDKVNHLPIVILTSSNEDQDRLRAYEHHANSYVQKPVDYDQFLAAAKKLGLYWLLLNQPPPIKKDT